MKTKVLASVAIFLMSLGVAINPINAQNNSNMPIIIAPIMTVPIAKPNAALTDAQKQKFYGENGPMPGHYKIRALHSGKCLIFRNRPSPINFNQYQANLQTTFCSTSPDGKYYENANGVNWVYFYFNAIIPSPNGSFTIRPYTSFKEPLGPNGRYELCGTVARGVVFGSAAIESMNCESPNGALSFAEIGAMDQKYKFKKLSGNVYEIHTMDGECLDVRDADMGERAEVIKFGCNGRSNQKFELFYLGPLESGETKNGVLGLGYEADLAGNLHRAVSVADVNITGPAYNTTIEANDYGANCRKKCVLDSRCVSYSWHISDPAVGPMCTLRDKLSTAVPLNGAVSGLVRP